MPVTNDRTPLTAPDIEVLPITDAAIPRWQGGDIGPELAEPLAIPLQSLFCKSGASVEPDGIVRDI